MLGVTVRTIKREFRIQSPDHAVARAMAFIKAEPDIEGPPPQPIALTIGTIHGFLRLVLPSGATVEGSAIYLLSELQRMHFEFSRAEFPEAPFVQCGTIMINAGHLILVGHDIDGVTALLLYLAAQGWPVSGGKHLIMETKAAIPRPRPLRVKTGALRHLPDDAADLVRASPSTTDWHGSPIYSVEPSAFGRPWAIRWCPIRHVVILHGNEGGRSRLRRLDWRLALEFVLHNTILPKANKGGALAEIRSQVSSADCSELWNGGVEDSLRLLNTIFK